MYLRGAHGGNDSSVSHNPHSAEEAWQDEAGLPALLRERFGLDLAAAQAAWMKLLDDA